MKNKKYLWLALLIFTQCWPSLSVAAEGGLIKSSRSSAVYYVAQNGLRYVFPNQQVYDSWYSDFSSVSTINHEELIARNLGGVVCYKPNTSLVKIVSDPKVYWVGENCLLRHVPNETAAANFFGSDWIKKIDILPIVYFDGYTIGEELAENGNLPTVATDLTIDINQVITSTNNTNNNDATNNTDNITNNTSTEVIVDEGQQPTSIKLTVIYSVTSGKATLSWLTIDGNTNYGFGIIKAAKDNPLSSDGDFYKLTNSTAESYDWENLTNGDYYFRICRLNSDGSCGTYSNTRTISVGSTNQTSNIALTGQVSGDTAMLNWQINWLSPSGGFYVVKGNEENPRYPANTYIWLDKTRDGYNWTGLSLGIHHFRVCSYDTVATLCTPYSNDLSLTIK